MARGPVHAQEAPAEDRRTVVIGEGNRVSGRVEIVEFGEPSPEFAAALTDLAAAAVARGLTVARQRRSPGGGALAESVALVVSAWPPADAADAPVLRAFAARRRGLLLLFGDGEDVAREFVPAPWQSGDAAVALLDVDPASGWRDASGAVPLTVFTDGPRGRPFAAVASPAAPAAPLALSVLRGAILRSGAVRHLRSAFADVSLRLDGDRLVVAAPTQVPGRVTMDAITLDGTPVLTPGPLRPLAAGEIPDPAGTLLRLRFEGGGLRDEARVGVSSAVRGRLSDAITSLRGLSTVAEGSAPRFRVTATHPDGAPLPSVAVTARLGDAETRATTDALGSAEIAFPAADRTSRRLALDVTLRDAWCERRLRTLVLAAPPEPVVAVQTDRATVRPGSPVRLRAFALDGARRPQPGADVTLEVRDPRGRLVHRFAGTTGPFGAIVGEMPVAATAAEGTYVVSCSSGKSRARATFEVEDVLRLPFDLRVDVSDRRAVPGGRVRGTVEVCDWDGAPVSGVTVGVAVEGGEPATLVPQGRSEFDVAVPESVEGGAVLRATASRGDDVVEADVPLHAPAARERLVLHGPSAAAPGSALSVRVAAQPDEIVEVDLVAVRRVLATATVRGDTVATLAVPADAAGAAQVVAQSRAARGRRAMFRVEIDRAPLAVTLDVPSAAAPGEEVAARVRVAGPEGRAAPALLDVRAIDRAVAVAAGSPPGDPRALADPAWIEPVRPLDSGADEQRWAGPEERANAAAEQLVHDAVAAAARGEAEPGVLPWGVRLRVGALDGRCVVVGEGPATEGPRGAGTFVCETVPGRAAGDVPALLLPVGGTARPEVEHPEWLCRHQSPDGSFHPSRFADVCGEPSCRDPGPAHLHVAATALVTYTFVALGETHQSGSMKGTVRAALDWLKRQQDDDGFVGSRGGPAAVFGHVAATLALTETYALTDSVVARSASRRALAALARRGVHPDLVRGGIATLLDASVADGAWASTRETLAVLRALDAAPGTAASGRAVAEVAGRQPISADLRPAVTEIDLGPWSAKDVLTLRLDASGPAAGQAPAPWATLCVRGTSASRGAAAGAPLAVEVAWPAAALRVGERADVVVALRNTSARRVEAPFVVVPFPAGFDVDRAALGRRSGRGVPLAEVADGEVRLYADDVPDGGAASIRLRFVARQAGRFTAAPATAYPYYEPAAVTSSPAVRLEVRPRD